MQRPELLQSACEVRRATEADFDAVAAIERASYSRRTQELAVVPWVVSGRAELHVLSLGERSRPVAFLCERLERDEDQIVSVATAPEHRRRGYARWLFGRVLEDVARRGARVVTLEVRRSNDAAIGLYRRLGFRTLGVRPLYYSDGREDALKMLMRLDRRSARWSP